MPTIDDIRRANLALLATEFGGNKPLAMAVGVSESQMAQWVHGAKESKTGKPRGLRLASCHRIEDKTGKPRGWLDTLHGDGITAKEPPGRYVIKNATPNPSLRACLSTVVDAFAGVSTARLASAKAQLQLILDHPKMRDDVLSELEHLLSSPEPRPKRAAGGQ